MSTRPHVHMSTRPHVTRTLHFYSFRASIELDGVDRSDGLPGRCKMARGMREVVKELMRRGRIRELSGGGGGVEDQSKPGVYSIARASRGI